MKVCTTFPAHTPCLTPGRSHQSYPPLSRKSVLCANLFPIGEEPFPPSSQLLWLWSLWTECTKERLRTKISTRPTWWPNLLSGHGARRAKSAYFSVPWLQSDWWNSQLHDCLSLMGIPRGKTNINWKLKGKPVLIQPCLTNLLSRGIALRLPPPHCVHITTVTIAWKETEFPCSFTVKVSETQLRQLGVCRKELV